MTATTSKLATAQAQRASQGIRRLALASRSFLAAIGSRWNAFIDAGQLGPIEDREIGRHTGARI